MSKALLIAAIIFVIALVAVLMWPAATPHARSHGASPDSSQAPAAAPHAEPYSTAEAFYSAWQAYLRGDSADTARISETAAHHNGWVTAIFPENAKDFHDGFRLTLGKYRILYPYLSGTVIDDYGILLIEIQNNKMDIVTALIKRGANLNKDFILTAATTPEMIDVLIRAGSDPNKPLPDGRSQRQYFMQLGRPDLVEALRGNSVQAAP
jgi:hypothetical protein